MKLASFFEENMDANEEHVNFYMSDSLIEIQGDLSDLRTSKPMWNCSNKLLLSEHMLCNVLCQIQKTCRDSPE